MLRTASVMLLVLYAVAASRAWAASRGALVFNRCKICHAVESGGRKRVGPNLRGLFGRKAGSLAGFACSPAMERSNRVWNDETLAEFLRHPQGFVPGTRMGVPGIADEGDLAALLDDLKPATR